MSKKNENIDICNIMGFICMEDITKSQEGMNTVVYNFNLNPQERISEFKRIMEARFPHRFTKEELDATLEYTPESATALIKLIRKYIFNHE